MKRLLAFACLLVLSGLVMADPISQFEEGLRLYRDNDMTGAIRVWQELATAGYASGPLYFNLGNAYYRSGEVAKSILNYERARLLLPRDPDVQTNLELARLAVVDKVETPVRLVVWDWVDRIRDSQSLREIARQFHALGFLGLALFGLWRLGPIRFQPVFRTVTLVCLVLWVMAGSWYVWRVSLQRQPEAIVLSSKTDAFSAPDASGTQLFSLHEGSKVRLGQSLSGWVNIELPDGRRGWVPVQDLERI